MFNKPKFYIKIFDKLKFPETMFKNKLHTVSGKCLTNNIKFINLSL